MAFPMKITGTTTSCAACPFRAYYSGGVYECTKAGANLMRDEQDRIPDWCPLGDYPIQAIRQRDEQIAELRRLLTEKQAA